MIYLFGSDMALWQGESRRSKTGRRIRYSRGKRKFEIGREAHLTTIGNIRIKKVRTLGRNQKIRAKTLDYAFIIDKKTNKTTKSKINSVIGNPANINYIRRNRYNYSPHIRGGRTVYYNHCLPNNYLSKSSVESQIEFSGETSKDRDRLFQIYLTKGDSSVRRCFSKLTPSRRKRLIKLLAGEHEGERLLQVYNK